jgi:hypothetical protein
MFFAADCATGVQMYTFPDWKKHRSSYRYVHHMNTILE